MEEMNLSPMPTIGLYVAAASFLCTLAMFLNSFFDSGMMFSRKFFALNATSLTLLAVAMKLTGDLTTPMWSPKDNLAKISSISFLTIAMGNFITSLGSMKGKEILTSVTALSILVITVLVDICIQLRTGAFDYTLFPEIIAAVIWLFFMFITIVSTALAVPAIKKQAESKYQHLHKLVSGTEGIEGRESTVEELRLSIRKFWVMAASGSPQFLVERLVTYSFTGIICASSASNLINSVTKMTSLYRKWNSECHKESEYKWSIIVILISQTLGILFCIRPSNIWLHFLYFEYEEKGIKLNKLKFTVDPYWIKKLVEWRQSKIPVRMKRHKVRKLLHDIKDLVLTVCIRVQIVAVMYYMLYSYVSFYFVLPFLFCFFHLRKWLSKPQVSDEPVMPETDNTCFVILLDGEPQLPRKSLRNIVRYMDELTKKGKAQQPRNLRGLLNGSFSFSGVLEFDNNQVPSLLPEELPNCWTLPVVTLTTIAISLPNIASQNANWLVSTVDEGLHYANLIETLDEKRELKRIQKAADDVWVGVQLYRKWLDIDLERKAREVNSAPEIIQSLSDAAKRIVLEFKSKESTILVESPLYWPANVIAANSMYRITQTILISYENGECQAEEQLFGKLICIIADIMAACLTNLPCLIATKCSCNDIEEREKSVHDAAIILGETEDILKDFGKCNLSGICPDQTLCIDEWRRWMERQNQTVHVSATSSVTPITGESNEHIVVQTQA